MLAIVTGASSGIGREASRLLVERGYRVVGVARWVSDDPLPGVEPVRLDLNDLDAIPPAITGVLARTGTPSVVLHCAGFGAYLPFPKQPEAEFERLLRVNFLAAARLTRAVLPAMLDARHLRRHLLFVSSMAARVGPWGHAGYAASKGAMRSFAESLHAELCGHRPHGEERIGCTLIYPGIVDTPYFEKGSMQRLWPLVRHRAIDASRVARGIVESIGTRRLAVYVPRGYAVLDWIYAASPRLAATLVRRGSRVPDVTPGTLGRSLRKALHEDAC
jgi:NAD(P)-dependent dehydrogenase (short-subunit alcohol dehydrogenase family)